MKTALRTIHSTAMKAALSQALIDGYYPRTCMVSQWTSTRDGIDKIYVVIDADAAYNGTTDYVLEYRYETETHKAFLHSQE